MSHEVRSIIGVVLIAVAVATLVISFIVWRRLRQPSALQVLRARLPDRAAQREAFRYLSQGVVPSDPALRDLVCDVAEVTLHQFDPTIVFASVILLLVGDGVLRPSLPLAVLGVLYLASTVFFVLSRRRLKAAAARILAEQQGGA
jgi:hypothetical protein